MFPLFHGMIVEIKLVWWPFLAFRDMARPISVLWDTMFEWCEGKDSDGRPSEGARVGHVSLRDAVDHYDGVHPADPARYKFLPQFAEQKVDGEDEEDAANRRKVYFVDGKNYDCVEEMYRLGKNLAQDDLPVHPRSPSGSA
jgi:hypothetical protein